MNEHLALYVSAEADRADVDNYKVLSQRANFGDACLRRSLFLIVLFLPPPPPSPAARSPLEEPQRRRPLSTIFKQPVCVCVSFFYHFERS